MTVIIMIKRVEVIMIIMMIAIMIKNLIVESIGNQTVSYYRTYHNMT
jgi:hypothetical protein